MGYRERGSQAEGGLHTSRQPRKRALGPPRAGWGDGAGEGPTRVGEGRSRASHNNTSRRVPTPTLRPRVPATVDALTQVEGPCGPQAAAASAGGASVARSVPAAPVRRVPPRAPAPAAAPPLPVPLPLRQMASGSSAPVPAWPRTGRSLTFTLKARSVLATRCPATPCWVLCFVFSATLLSPVVCTAWASVFPTAASPSPAFPSPRCDGCHPSWNSGQCSVTSR